jgi:hypothetical protein
MALRKIKPNDPCICGSGKKFQKCCGTNGQPRYVSTAISLTGIKTHHFFLINSAMTKPVMQEGAILVWTSREAAMRWGHSHIKTGECPSEFASVGMGDEKWRLFQMETNFKIVE